MTQSESPDSSMEAAGPVVVDSPSLWTCPTCYHDVATAYCPSCGERPLDPRQLTFRGMMRQLVHYLTGVDSKVVNAVRTVLTQPGALTLAFQNGKRMPYLGPLKIFILANVVFFAAQSSTDLRIYATQLHQQVDLEDGTDIARRMVDRYLAEKGLTLQEYEPIYNQVVAVNARSMIGLMVLPFAMFLPLVFWKSGRPFAVPVVFSLHFYAFMLLVYCLPVALIVAEKLLGGSALTSRTGDNVISFTLLSVRFVYLYVAINRVYDSRGIKRGFQALALVGADFFCFLGYRFILLPITLFMTW